MAAPRNRTIQLSEAERRRYGADLAAVGGSPGETNEWAGRLAQGDLFELLPSLPVAPFIDLLFLDPPYNLNKKFRDLAFARMDDEVYADWIDSWLAPLVTRLKPTATIYACADWQTSIPLATALRRHFRVRNRITWERGKGRGARANWKNNAEDIWFCTFSDDYTFNLDTVKVQRRVIAPYRDNGKPKDWDETANGNFRLTHPSNIWTDITVPFWSMPENTPHPTQKPEKLLAKLLLASTNPGDFVFDPFAGSGSTLAVAKKLGRRFAGIELDPEYCLYALKRLETAEANETIQGYRDGIFWERNSAPAVRKHPERNSSGSNGD